jgi:hypothetical protein
MSLAQKKYGRTKLVNVCKLVALALAIFSRVSSCFRPLYLSRMLTAIIFNEPLSRILTPHGKCNGQNL